MKRVVVPCVVFFLLSCGDLRAAEAAEQYLCVGEQSTGFKFSNGSWTISKFNVKTDKYVVKSVKKDSDSEHKTDRFEVVRLGEDQSYLTCERIMFNDIKTSRILCGGIFIGMLIDTKAMRYYEVHGSGYIDNKQDLTPFMTIGMCSAL